MSNSRAWVELRSLEIGARFRFYAFPDQTAVLVEKGSGRALIRYDQPRNQTTRTFTAHDSNGQLVTRTVTPKVADVEPCALGANVVPLETT